MSETLPVATRNHAMLAHLSAAIAQFFFPTLGVIGPVLVMLWKGDDDEVAYHARQAAMFQLLILFVGWLGGVSCVLFFLTGIAWIVGVVVPAVAAVKVNNGEDWEYPVTGGMVQRRIS